MLSHMDEVLGTRYCEPTAMKANMIMTKAMQLIMKGTFNRADLAGSTGTRWQMLDELVESCSAEDVGKLQDARGAPSGPASSMISTPRQRRAWRRLRILHRRLRILRRLPILQKFIFSRPDRISGSWLALSVARARLNILSD